ncbi:glycosyltransferase [Limnohabitans sp. Rim47]|uniref:glycosyltransferase n=1 Tax=Limnohabitans sp. Rim47 TaxID=1100721 RepID=UPI000306620C|nr:glycosyltransferase [Limnohabitans sp. Rim47]
MANAPKVTLLVPAFNEPEHILEQSLTSVMAQTFTDFECIVVDESTRPEAAQACQRICARDPRFRYIHPTERLGLPGSLNLAISMARAKLLARFDSDDICLPERLDVQVTFMDAHPDIGVVGAGLQLIDETGRPTAERHYPERSDDIARKLHFTSTLAHPTVMYRTDIVKRFGGYDPTFRFAEDLDLWLRWLNRGVKFANVPEVLVKYRQAQTCRHPTHWRFNLRARVRNFGSSHLLRRVAGIACIGIWSILPSIVQESIFRLMLLRDRP